MSENKLAFQPLNPENISRSKTPAGKPVNWFIRLAPTLPEVEKPITTMTKEELTWANVGNQKVSFRPIEEIASEEHQLQRRGDEEPMEVLILRAKAQEEAKQIVSDALAQAGVIQDQARDEGYRDGYARGIAEGETNATAQVMQRAEEERTALHADITDFVLNIEAERERAWTEMEPMVIEMVFDLARLVIKQEVEVSRNIALGVIRSAMRRLSEGTTLRIRVSPEDLEKVRSNRDTFLDIVDGVQHIEIIEDRRISKGGTILETEAGSVDARIETQLDSLGDTLSRMIATGGIDLDIQP